MALFTGTLFDTSTHVGTALDVTRGSEKSDPTSWLLRFAPSWDLLRAYKGKRIDWPAYTRRYYAEMRASYEAHETDWLRLARMAVEGDVTLLCFCHWATEAKPECHRFLLRDMLRKVIAKQSSAGLGEGS